MDPRRLELLLQLSRLGSMRAVADVMNVTTSTVSQQIAALAQEAGTPLLEHEGRGVRLTPAGLRLADHAVNVLAALDAAPLVLEERGAGLLCERRDLLGDGRGGDVHDVGDRAHGAEAGQLEEQLEPARVHGADCPGFPNTSSTRFTWT